MPNIMDTKQSLLYPYADKTILIEVPSFKDPELLNTIYSALVQADVPDRIRFSVCYQDDDLATLEKLHGIKHMSVKHLMPDEARGTCYARWWCQEMYDGENFAFHVDSHMRFLAHWDTRLLEQWHACGNEKAVISFYTSAVPHEQLALKLDAPEFEQPRPGARVGVKIIDAESWRVSFQQKLYTKDMRGVMIREHSPFISGHYAFGPGSMSTEVRMDPNMWYQGDEFAYGIRLYTYGYDVYNTELCYALHKYLRPERAVPPMNGRRRIESERLKVLMGISDAIDIGEYGPGRARTIAEYQKFAGIDFAKRELRERAITGIYKPFEGDNRQ